MDNKQKILDNLHLKQKFLGNAAALLAGLLLLMTVVFYSALPAYIEITALLAQEQAQAERLTMLADFAAKHADYAAYEKQKYKQLAAMQQNLWQLTDSNQAQNKLQKLAQKQGLAIKQLQNLSTDANKATMKMELLGNYFAFLRWLEHAEKMPLTVQKIELKGQTDGNVCISLLLQCSFAHNK